MFRINKPYQFILNSEQNNYGITFITLNRLLKRAHWVLNLKAERGREFTSMLSTNNV